MKLTVKEIAHLALCTAILHIAQIALAFLPNIELVSLLVMLFTLVFRGKALYIIYGFALLQGLLYGFTTWWVTYLYIWTVLFFLTSIFRASTSPLVFAVISGAFGLSFGLLCEIPFFFVIGAKAAFAAFLSGIPFDLAHCAGNFVLALLLMRPLHTQLVRLVGTQEV